jgi:hypothetical protein
MSGSLEVRRDEVIRLDEAESFYRLATDLRPLETTPASTTELTKTRRWDGCCAAWRVIDYYHGWQGNRDIILTVEEMLLKELFLNRGAQIIQDCGIFPLKPDFRSGYEAVGSMLSGRCDLFRNGQVAEDRGWLEIQS